MRQILNWFLDQEIAHRLMFPWSSYQTVRAASVLAQAGLVTWPMLLEYVYAEQGKLTRRGKLMKLNDCSWGTSMFILARLNIEDDARPGHKRLRKPPSGGKKHG